MKKELLIAAAISIFLGGIVGTANAIPYQFTFTTTVTSSIGTPGVTDGDLLTLNILGDNGGTDLFSQSWFQTDIISAVASVGTYEANFFFPHYNNDPVFLTNGSGALSSTAWYDIDSNNTDNLGIGSPGFYVNALVTSQVKHLVFSTSSHPNSPENWSVSAASGPAPVPEPTTMLLFGTGLAGLVGLRRKKQL